MRTCVSIITSARAKVWPSGETDGPRIGVMIDAVSLRWLPDVDLSKLVITPHRGVAH